MTRIVDKVNELREADAVLDSVRMDEIGSARYKPLLVASGVVAYQLWLDREKLADECAPWFQVQQ